MYSNEPESGLEEFPPEKLSLLLGGEAW